MSKITKITAFFLFFIMCFCLHVTAAVSDLVFDRPIVQVETCSTAGEKQTRYTYDGVCSYTSETRECCGLSWSAWGEDCPSASDCTSSQCWNGSSCVVKGSTSRNCSGNVTNASSGTQTRTARCVSGTGWMYGSWTGTCTCKSGYTWNSSTNTCGSSCTKTCSSNQVLDKSCTCCNLGCYIVSGGSGTCNCISGTYMIQTTCCLMTNGVKYQLPYGYSNCSAFASAFGFSLKSKDSYCSQTIY